MLKDLFFSDLPPFSTEKFLIYECRKLVENVESYFLSTWLWKAAC